MMEHHSNDLPWRRRATVVRAGVTADGRLDEDDFDRLLDAATPAGSRWWRCSGASNVTGFVPASPSPRAARRTRWARASSSTRRSWSPHRAIDVRRRDGTRSTSTSWPSRRTRCTRRSAPASWSVRAPGFSSGAPDIVGGGTVETVTEDDGRVGGRARPRGGRHAERRRRGRDGGGRRQPRRLGHGGDRRRTRRALAGYARGRLRDVPGVTIYGDDGWRRPAIASA